MENIDMCYEIVLDVEILLTHMIAAWCYCYLIKPFMTNRKYLWTVGASYVAVMETLWVIPYSLSNFCAYFLGVAAGFTVMVLTDLKSGRLKILQKIFLAYTFFSVRWLVQSMSAGIEDIMSAVLTSLFVSDGIMTEDLSKSPIAESTFEIIKKLIVQSLPISLGAVIINLSSLIDLLTISGGIQEVFVEKSEFFLTHYPLAVKESGVDNIGNFVYGSYTGIVLSLFMIITSLTSLVGKSALPGIAAAYECGKKDELKKQVNILLSGIFIIGLPLCMSLSLLSEPVLSLLYPVRPAEVSVSITPLSVLCAGGIPIALCSGIFSVFQATGRSDIPIKLMMTGSVVKLIFNLLFIRIPFLSFSGAALSTVVSHITVSILGIIYLNKILEIECRPLSLMSRPFMAASACAAVSAFSYYILFDALNDIIRMLLSIAAGGLTYSVILLLVDKRLIELLKNYRKRKISV